MKILIPKSLLISIILFITILHGGNKYDNSKNLCDHDDILIDIGKLHQSVIADKYLTLYGDDMQTFVIGNRYDGKASLQWKDNEYDNNNYLYHGFFWIGYNENTIRLNYPVLSDLKVSLFDPTKNSPFEVLYSMNDDSASSDNVGIKVNCIINAWPENDRDDFLIYQYYVVNNSSRKLEDVYAGLYMDYDVSSAEGGSGITTFSRDDISSFLLGDDINGNTESISYMYDGDNPNVYGDDTGGRLNPKESNGFIGSRIIQSPETKHGVIANQQNGHYWQRELTLGYWGYHVMQTEMFESNGNWPMDHRVSQTLGPWDIEIDDTLHISFALGIGEGLGGMRTNLQTAYDLYWNNFKGPSMPYILNFSPNCDTIIVYKNDTELFLMNSIDKDNNELFYTWQINESYSAQRDSFYVFYSSEFTLGFNEVKVEVTNNQYTNVQSWIVDIRPAKKYELAQNYPNPFNGITTIPFELQKDGNVNITIYDVLGRKVKTLINKPYTFGKHTITWDGTDIQNNSVASGIYFYLIKSGNFQQTKRLLYMK
jgi:type IX secretion system substrate protein